MSLQESLDGSHLVIASDFTSAKFQLLAIDETLSSEIQSGAQLTIKGGETSEAVLCSETATYSLRVVESSNSTLLARDVHSDSTDLDASQLPEERTVLALGSVPHVWEVKPSAPPLAPLLDLLRPTAYGGPSDQAASQSSSAHQDDQTGQELELYSFAALLRKVPSSAQQLRDLLRRAGAFVLDGAYRIVSSGYWYQAVDTVLVAAAELGMGLQHIQPNELYAAVVRHCESVGHAPLREELLLHILQQLGARKGGAAEQQGAACDTPITLDEETVCLQLPLVARHRAREILQALPAGRPAMDALSFVKAWHQTLKMHDGVQYSHCAVSTLAGLALLVGGDNLPAGAPGVLDGELLAVPEGGSIAQQVVFFPEDSLSEDHAARFAELFAAQELWRLEDMLPFLEPVRQPGQAVSDMLLAHCRYVTQPDGSKLYCAK